MRWPLVTLLVAASIARSAASFAVEDVLDFPLRKAGLWDVSTQTDEGSGPRKETLQICIGDEMERNAVATSGRENRANCSKYDVKRTGEGTIVDAQCAYDDRKVVTHTELLGDFTTVFKVKMESATTGTAPRALGGHPVNVHRTISQEGTYLGESCGDLKAGDAKTVDGRTVTVQ